jgi:hypothetical protein
MSDPVSDAVAARTAGSTIKIPLETVGQQIQVALQAAINEWQESLKQALGPWAAQLAGALSPLAGADPVPSAETFIAPLRAMAAEANQQIHHWVNANAQELSEQLSAAISQSLATSLRPTPEPETSDAAASTDASQTKE